MNYWSDSENYYNGSKSCYVDSLMHGGFRELLFEFVELLLRFFELLL